MERLNAINVINALECRQLSQPEGKIAAEKLELNLAALEKLQATNCAIIEWGACFFQKGDLSGNSLGALNQNQHDLVTYALRYNATIRDFWNIYYLGGGGCSTETLSAKGAWERNLKTLLGDAYGWDQQRIKWLLQEMNEELATEFKWILALNALYDKTAQGTDWETLDVWKLDEMKPVVNAILDAERKAEVGGSLYPQDYFDNSLDLREDFATFVAIMEMSLTNNAAPEKIPETV